MTAILRSSSAPSIRTVIEAVCHHYDVRHADVVSTRRTRDIIRPRQVAMYLSKQLTPASLPAIGRMIGGRDHTTVLHGVKTIGDQIACDAELRGDVETISGALGVVSIVLGPSADRDPLEVALAIVSRRSAATTVSLDDIDSVARCLIGFGLSLGALRFEGDDDQADPELAVPAPGIPIALSEAITAVRSAYDGFATARYSKRERDTLDGLSRALLGLFEAHATALDPTPSEEA